MEGSEQREGVLCNAAACGDSVTQVGLGTLPFFFFNLFLTALGLRCCVRAFSSCGERRLLFVVVHELLIVVASLVEEHGL